MRRAVTLIEVLVGLALAALLAVAVQSLVVQAYRTQQRLLGERQKASALSVPIELLRQDLSALSMVNAIELRDGGLRVTTLSDLSPDSAAARHALDVRYQLQRDGDAAVLIRAQRELNESDERVQSISSALKSVRFEVFDGVRWHAEWPPSNPRPPRGVRCTLIGRKGETATLRVACQPLTWRSHAR